MSILVASNIIIAHYIILILYVSTKCFHFWFSCIEPIVRFKSTRISISSGQFVLVDNIDNAETYYYHLSLIQLAVNIDKQTKSLFAVYLI